jgi:hypothetical protein
LSALPGWDSLESAARYSKWFAISGLIALAFVVIFDVLAFVYSDRKDALVSAEASRRAEADRHAREPRRLTGAQKEELVRQLKGTVSAVVIVSRVLDTESSDFAGDFDTALRAGAHWDTLRIRNRLSSKYGVSLGTVTGTQFSPEARLLDNALIAIGIVHDNPVFANGDASTSPAFQPGYLYLVIEQKPPVIADK